MIILRIYRTDGQYDVHQLDIKPETKLLTLFEQIRTEIDPTFAFSSGCRHGICGSCAVKVNGLPALACKTEIGNFHSGVLRIEPLNGESPKIDLLSDFEEFYRSFSSFPNFLESNGLISKKIYEPEAVRCIQCGICYYSCPTVSYDKEFPGPAAALKNERFLSDPADTITQSRLEEAVNRIYRCVKCYRCVEYCPRSLDPEKAIEKTRRLCLTRQEETIGTFHTKALFDSIYHYGKINETFTARYLFGFWGSLPLILSGLPFLFKRRVRLRPLKAAKLKEIRRLLEMEND